MDKKTILKIANLAKIEIKEEPKPRATRASITILSF